MDPVAIVGTGQTRFEAEMRGRTYADLAYEVASKALEDAGLGIAEVGNIVTASNDFLDGRTISSMAVGDAVGAAFGDGKNVSTVEGDGAFAAFYGLARILSGAYETTLVVAHSKPSEGDHRLITNACFDPVYERGLGLDWISAAALQARLCMDRRGWSEEELARVVVRNRGRGAKNPHAQLRLPVSLEEALRSEPLASPIKRAEAAPLSDGAAAVVLASGRLAGKLRRKPVWIRGVGLCAEARMTERPLWESAALKKAGEAAFRMAGVREPSREISIAELSAPFAYQELLWLEALGLEGLPAERINPSGGCLCAYPPVPAGLVRIIEAALQLRGEAAVQVPGAGPALAHGQQGLCGQSHCVWILGN